MIELDRIPKVGDTFEYESKHKLFKVRVTRLMPREHLDFIFVLKTSLTKTRMTTKILS